MSDNERIAKRAVEIAEELRKALPPNTDFGEGWQQRYLDRQNERYEKALEMARTEAELPPGELTEDEWREAAVEAKAARGTVASRAPEIRGVDEQDIPAGVPGRVAPLAFSTAQVRAIADDCGVSGTVQALYRFAVAAALGVPGRATDQQEKTR